MLTKNSCLPYDFIDTYEKLDYEGLIPYEHFFNTLKGKNVSEQEYVEKYVKPFEKYGCKNMSDWVRVYNNADVGPAFRSIR